MQKSITKFVLVPCKMDKEGKIIPNRSPHGYHHILRVYNDKSHWLVAMIDASTSMRKTQKIMRDLAGKTPCVTQADFYEQADLS